MISITIFWTLSDGHNFILSLTEMNYSIIRFGPTFFHNLGKSELYFCAVSGFDADCNSLATSEFPVPGGHLWLYFAVSWDPGGDQRSGGSSVRRRDWSRYSNEAYCEALASLDWSPIAT